MTIFFVVVTGYVPPPPPCIYLHVCPYFGLYVSAILLYLCPHVFMFVPMLWYIWVCVMLHEKFVVCVMTRSQRYRVKLMYVT
jgi:hypothetical protein